MFSRKSRVVNVALAVLLIVAGCSESNEKNVQPTQSLTLRAASAVASESIEFSSYDSAAVDVVVNDGETQSFVAQSSPDWVISVEGVNVGQENTLEVEWYILHDSGRYTIATQSGTFIAMPTQATFTAPYVTDTFDHDNDSVSNLTEVNAGGFPVPSAAIPEVVDVVTPGTFTIGTPVDEPGMLAYANESPRQTAITNNYSIGKFEVTYDQYATYIEAIKSQNLPSDNNWGGDDLPVTNVSWSDAYAYTAWLSKISGDTYRLPTEAEWEFAARGNSSTAYPTGQTINIHNANFITPILEAYYFSPPLSPDDPDYFQAVFRYDGARNWTENSIDGDSGAEQVFAVFEEIRRDSDGIWIDDSSRGITLVISPGARKIRVAQTPTELADIYTITDDSSLVAQFVGTRPVVVGSFPPNAFGLHDMHGNVWEWTCSQLEDTYLGAEQACVQPELADTDPFQMVKRGGSWNVNAREIRSANRGWNDAYGQRDNSTGFRVVREP